MLLRRNVRTCRVLFFLLLVSILSIKMSGLVHASDGTPFVMINVPGTFQAEDFNSGAINDVYYAHPSAQVTRETTYRDVANVDLYWDGTNRYVVSSDDQVAGSQTFGYVSEYLKYTINVGVGNDGWHDISFNAKQGAVGQKGNITVLIDGVQKGSAGPVTGTTLQNYTLPMPVYLGVGAHVLTIEFSGSPATYLNSITFTKRGSAPTFPAPAIKTGLINSSEVVVANVTVTADTTGVNDATTAIQNALDQAREMGGGVVFLPAGTYRLNGGLSVSTNVVIRGDWGNPVQGTPQNGTILAAYSTTVSAVTLTGNNSVVRDLSIWYPVQGSYTGGVFTPTVYPYSVYSTTSSVNVFNMTFYNSYNGIYFTDGSATNLNNIYGTFLNQGITLDGDYEYSYITNVLMDSGIWKNAPSAITNKPDSAQTGYINNYTNANLYGIKLWKNDGLTVYNISVNKAQLGILLEQGPPSSNGSYGAMSQINATLQENYVRAEVGEFLNSDKVWQGRSLAYVFAPAKKPASSTNFYNVQNAPYNAKGDAITDDGTAIQNALNAAGSAGGGTVFLPPGSYKITGTLSVPTGVELRGSYDYLHAHENLDTTVLLAYNGKNTATPDTATAFITLNANAGIRGFTVYYPEQGFVDGNDTNVPADLRTLYPIKTFPYTVRSAGSGTWMKYIEIENGYNGADFATNASNDFVISGVWINAAKKAIFVGGGTTGGWVEQAIITFGTYFQSKHNNSPHTYGFGHALNYTRSNADAFIVGNSSNIQSFAVDSYGVYSGVKTIKEGVGTGPQNLLVHLPSVDTSNGPNVTIEGGGTIQLVGLQAANIANQNYARTTAAFTGTLNIYDSLLWATIIKTVSVGGGTVNVYDKDLSLYSLPISQAKTATSNSSYNGDTPDRAVDGIFTSKWTSTAASPNWIKVDLGQTYTINRWVVKHAGINGESTAYNTKDFKLQVSSDGTNFTDVDTVTGNTSNLTDRTILTEGRYVRLYITQGTQTGSDGYARIYDFTVYGERPEFANSYNLTNEKPVYASDNNDLTKWVSLVKQPADYWLRIDLGETYSINRWVVKHPGSSNPSDSIYNAKAYKLQVSSDGTNFTDVDSVTGNSANSTDRNITTTSARYVRLYITEGTQTGSDGYARIQEFEVYNTIGTNVALNKAPYANNYNLSNEQPVYAVDGTVSTKWVSITRPSVDYWLTLDLGQLYNIKRWYMLNAGGAYNTRDYKLQISSDGSNFTDADTVTGNTADSTHRILAAAVQGRYVRLVVTQATQLGSDGYARIQEFRVYD